MRSLLVVAVVVFAASCTCGVAPTEVDGGAGGGTGATGGGGGTASCGQYATRCNGACIPTVNDPANCGACGRACAGAQVCTGGSCQPAAACPASLTACNGRCVDLKSSNTYCGACTATAACPSGQGCSGGTCVKSVVLDGGGPANCAAGGPPVFVGPEAGPQVCAGTIAQVTFRWALCSCSGITTSAAINTDGFSSNLGPVDGGIGGSVGANGNYSSSAAFNIGGSLWLKGGLTEAMAARVKQELHVDGNAIGGGTAIDRDAFVTGDVSGLAIAGKLFVPAASLVGPTASATGGVVRGPVTVPVPCDCDPAQLINIKSVIAQGKAVNDNATIGLDPNVLTGSGTTGPIRLDLPCGRYFLKAVTANAPVTIAVHGRTAVFIEDNVNVSQDLAFFVDTAAELDVFIGGGVSTSGAVRFGAADAPAQSRFYIGGDFSTSTGGTIAGNFFLPKSSFTTSGAYTVYGSVFCGSLSASSALNLHYDKAVLNAGELCGTLPLPVFDGGAAGCGSCRDCGNQACNAGKCGACTDSSQCCSPLFCSNGACVAGEIN